MKSMIRCTHCKHLIADPYTLSIEEHFWSLVEKTDDCWIWVGTIADCGYGRLSRKGCKKYAHRISFEFSNGPIPKGMVICHTCDNPKCVNPDHLFLGTNRDNTLDMISKRRHSHGEKHPGSKLVADDVRAIRLLYPTLSYKKIGEQYGVAHVTIRDIITGVTWKEVM